MDIRLRIEGCIYGHLIADALSANTDNTKKISRNTISQWLARYYQDSGAMTLCTMSSLNDCQDIDTEDIVFKFQDWYLGSYLQATQKVKSSVALSQALRMYSNGMPPDRCGSKNHDYSAIIRILPIALWDINNTNTMIKNARQIAAFTNNHPDDQDCATLYCLAMRALLLQKKEKIVDVLKQHDETRTINEQSEYMKPFWDAWNTYANNADDYENAIISIMEQDPDLACLTGALVGANVGINEIPQRWLNQLSLSEEANDVISAFMRTISKKSEGLYLTFVKG